MGVRQERTLSDSYTIKATVTDDDTLFASASATLTVNNVAPSNLAVTQSPVSINENDSTTLTGTFSDLGTLDTHTVNHRLGDGSPNTVLSLAAGVLSIPATSHQYLDDGVSPGKTARYRIFIRSL